jgi:hypothetical protein
MESWPDNIRSKLEKFVRPELKEDFVPLQEGVDDKTAESMELIAEFQPMIQLPKRHLFRRTEGGLFARALENDSGNRRCLQYLYVFPYLVGLQSYLWNLIVPILMIGWAALVLVLFPLGSLPVGLEWLAILAVATTLLPLLIWGILPHLKDFFRHPSGSRLNIRPASWLILYYIMTLAVTVIWYASADYAWLALYVALVLILVTFSISLVRARRRGARHELDYISILVWVVKGVEEWALEKVCWPYFNKRTICMDSDVLGTSPFRIRRRIIHKPEAIGIDKRVRFFLDNTWNSIQLGSKEPMTLKRVIVTDVVILVSLLALLLALGSLLLTTPLMVFIGASLFLISLLAAFSDWPTELPDSYQEKGIPHLTNDVLRRLWSLTDEARLPVKWKLQFPFFDEDLYFLTMEDQVARVVVDSFDQNDSHYVRVVVQGHSIPDVSNDDETVSDDEEPKVPVRFEKRLELTHETLTRLINTKSVGGIVEGDVFETHDATATLRYVEQYLEKSQADKDAPVPHSGIQFVKITKRVKAEFQDLHRVIIDRPKPESLFMSGLDVEGSEEKSDIVDTYAGGES